MNERRVSLPSPSTPYLRQSAAQRTRRAGKAASLSSAPCTPAGDARVWSVTCPQYVPLPAAPPAAHALYTCACGFCRAVRGSGEEQPGGDAQRRPDFLRPCPGHPRRTAEPSWRGDRPQLVAQAPGGLNTATCSGPVNTWGTDCFLRLRAGRLPGSPPPPPRGHRRAPVRTCTWGTFWLPVGSQGLRSAGRSPPPPARPVPQLFGP